MVFDDEDEYQPTRPLLLYGRRDRETLRTKLRRALATWRDMLALVIGLCGLLILHGCAPSTPAPKVGNQGGYAVVKPFYGCPEVQQMARPYVTHVVRAGAAGSGFALFMWAVPWTLRAAKRQRNRALVLRKLGRPTLLDRLWRATVGRLVAWGIKTWQDERGGPIR